MVALSINSSFGGYSNFAISRNQSSVSRTIDRISTGDRIRAAADDVSGLSVSTTLSTRLAAFRRAQINVSQAASLLEVANGGLNRIDSILQRMSALSVMSNGGAVTNQERVFLDKEFQELEKEIDRIANETNFNGVNLLNRLVEPVAIDEVITDTSIASEATSFITFQPFAVGAGNGPPFVTGGIPDQLTNTGVAYNYVIPPPPAAFDDPDADPLTYTANLVGGAPLPPWLSFNGATGTFSGTPGPLDAGVLDIEVNATDGVGIATDVFQLTVFDPPQPPFVVNPFPDQNLGVGPFTLTIPPQPTSFDDPNLDVLTFSAQLNGGGPLPAWLSFNPTTRQFFGNPTLADVGTYTIDVIATDPTLLTATDTFDIVITDPPDPPTDIILSNDNIDEDALVGTVIGGLTTIDPDLPGDAHTYSIVADPDNRFTIVGSNLVLNNPLDFETATSHTVTIRTTDSTFFTYDETFTITVNNVNEPPTDMNLSTTTVAENLAVGGTIATISTTDVDLPFDSHTYTILADPDNVFTIVGNQLRLSNPLDFETSAAHTVTIRTTDSGGLTYDELFNITVTDVNEAPFNLVDVDLAANAVDEDAAIGTPVNITAQATDLDAGDVLTYTLDVDAGGLFTINPVTGIVTVNGALDFETATSHNITVRATDLGGLFTTANFTININDINEPPFVAAGLTNQTVDETNLLTYTFPDLPGAFDDVDAGDSLTYSAQLFGGGPLPGWLTFTPATRTFSGTPPGGTAGVYTIEVTATDTGLLTATDTFTITVNDINDPPTDFDLDNLSVNENSAVGTLVGNLINVVDLDLPGDTHTFAIAPGGDPDGVFQIVGTQLQVGGAMDFETATTHNVTIRVTDSGGLFYDELFTINVGDVNEPPFVAAGLTDQVTNEGVAFNYTFPDIPGAFDDVDAGDSLTYTAQLFGGGALPAWLSFNGATRTFSGTPGPGDVGTITVEVTGTDTGLLTATDTFDITVNFLNDPPTDVDLDNLTVNENEAVGTFIANIINVVDPDLPFDSHTFSIAPGGDPDGVFQITGTQLEVGGAMDFENAATHNVTIRVTDAGGLFYDETFTINVGDVNDPPTDFDLDNLSVNENSAVGTLVGNLITIVDQDLPGDVHTFAIAPGGDPDGVFQVVGTQLQVGGAMDFETATTHNVTIRVTDGAGAFYDELFTINVGDVNEPPFVAAGLTDQTTNEGAAFNYTFPDIPGAFDDIDAGDSLTYTAQLFGGGALPAWLSFNGATRTFSGTPGPGDVGTITVEVTATDTGLLSTTDTFDITVNNVNTAPTDFDLDNLSVDENQAVGTLIGNLINIVDADLPFDAHTFAIAPGGDPDGVFQVVGTQLQVGGAMDFETATTHNVTIRVTDGGGLFYDETFTINVGDVNEAPFVAAGLTDQVTDEGIAFNYTFPDIPGAFDDVDAGDSLTYTAQLFGGGALPAWLSFNGATRTFSGTPGVGDVGTITVEVTATDTGLLSTTDTFDITVNFLNDPPTDFDLDSLNVDENQAVGTLVGNLITIVDPDLPADTHTFSIAPGGDPDGVFQVVGTQLQVGGAMDFENAATHNVTIRVTDAGGLFYDETFTINVNDINDAPTDFDLDNLTVDENQAVGTLIGNLNSIVDQDLPGDTHTFSIDIGGDPDGVFQVVGNQLQVGGAMDFETATTHNVTIRVTDFAGAFYTETFTINVGDVNEAPFVAAGLTDQTIDEGSPLTYTFPDIPGAFDDVDAGDSLTYSAQLFGGGALPAWLSFNAATRTFSGTPAVTDVGTITVEVTATDTGLLSTTDTFDITVNFANDPPTDFDLDNLAIDENEAVGTFIGNLINIVDADLPADTHTFSIAPGGDPDGVFQITGTQLEVGGAMDFETSTTHNVTIRVTDAGGLFYDETFTINVGDINEAPFNLIDANGVANRVNEGGNIGDVVNVTAQATDLDAGDMITYSLDVDAGGRFVIDPNTGIVTLNNPGLIDFATNPNHVITVRATDLGGLFTTANFTINVNQRPDDIQVTDGSIAAGFIRHWNAEDIDGDGLTTDNPANGTGIASFIDSVASDNGAEQGPGAQPVMATDAINGRDAIDFSATDSHYNPGSNAVINNANFTQKTLHATFRTGADISGWQVIYEQGGNVRGYSISIDGGRLYAYVYNTPEWAAGFEHFPLDLGPVAANTTYSVTAVHDATPAGVVNDTWTAYLNGVQVAQATNVDFQRPHGNAPGIGDIEGNTVRPTTQTVQNEGTGFDFEGQIAEIYMWNTALNATQVRDLQDLQDAEWDATLRIDENVPIGTVVGTLSGTDPEGNLPLTFSIVGGSVNTFDIVGNNIVTLGNIDFETFTSHTVTVRATDSFGATFDKVFTIDVVDIAADGGPAGPNPAFTPPPALTQFSGPPQPPVIDAGDIDESVYTAFYGTLSPTEPDHKVYYTFENAYAFNPTMQDMARAAMDEYEAVANIEFIEGSDPTDGSYDLTFGMIQNINGGIYQEGTFILPNGTQAEAQVGISSLYTDYEQMIAVSGTYEGSFTYLTVLHEIGHHLGLEHPDEVGLENTIYDHSDYSVMSYNLSPEYLDGTRYGVFEDDLGALDIAALQHLYGSADGSIPASSNHNNGSNSTNASPQAFTAPTPATAPPTGDFIVINGVNISFLPGADPIDETQVEYDAQLPIMLQRMVDQLNASDNPLLSQADYELITPDTVKIKHKSTGDYAERFRVSDFGAGLRNFITVTGGVAVNQHATQGNYILGADDFNNSGTIGSGTVTVGGQAANSIILSPRNESGSISLTLSGNAINGEVLNIDDGDGSTLDFTFLDNANPLNAFEIQIGDDVTQTLDNIVAKLSNWVSDFGTLENNFVMQQIDFERISENTITFTNKVAFDAYDYTTNQAGLFITMTNGALSSNSFSNGTSFGINADGISNKDFYGTINNFEAEYIQDNRVTLSVVVGDHTYRATVENTNAFSNSTVRMESSSGGYFDLELQGGQGIEVFNQTTADSFANMLNAAMSTVDFYQQRTMTNYNPTSSLDQTEIQLVMNDYTNPIFIESLEIIPAGSNLNQRGNEIQMVINGTTYKADLGEDEVIDPYQDIRLVSELDSKSSITIANLGETIDISSQDALETLEQDLTQALPVGGYLDRDLISFQIGVNQDESLDLELRAVTMEALFDDPDALGISTKELAQSAFDQIANAIDIVTSRRAYVGSMQSRSEVIAAALDSKVINEDSARAELADTDIAMASTDFANQTAVLFASTGITAQANDLHSDLVGQLFNQFTGAITEEVVETEEPEEPTIN